MKEKEREKAKEKRDSCKSEKGVTDARCRKKKKNTHVFVLLKGSNSVVLKRITCKSDVTANA